MQIELTDEEARTLRAVLAAHLPDLRREAAATDLGTPRELRHELAVRQTLCERLLNLLDARVGKQPAHA